MSVVYRLAVPESVLFTAVPLVAINVALQALYLLGLLPDYDGILFSYFISGAYLTSVLMEVFNIYRER